MSVRFMNRKSLISDISHVSFHSNGFSVLLCQLGHTVLSVTPRVFLAGCCEAGQVRTEELCIGWGNCRRGAVRYQDCSRLWGGGQGGGEVGGAVELM